MRIFQRHAIQLCMLIAILSACGPVTPGARHIEKNRWLDDKLYEQISNERQAWEALGITNYQIEVNHSDVFSNYTLILSIQEDDINLIQATCGTALLDHDGTYCPETLRILTPSAHTISGFFESAIKSRKEYYVDIDPLIDAPIWSEQLRIEFDPEYHYPREIVFLGHPNWSDTQYSTEILHFQILHE